MKIDETNIAIIKQFLEVEIRLSPYENHQWELRISQ